MMSRTAVLGILLVSVALPLAAQGRDDDEYRSRIDSTFAFDKNGTVSLSLQDGEIIVRAWERNEIHVRAYSERSTIRLDASSMRVSLDLLREHGGDARYEVTVPVGARVSARAMSGDISIIGAHGGVDASTQSGDVEVEDVGNMVDLSSVSGDVIGRRLNGDVEVRAISGDVMLEDVHGDVEAGSVSGDVDMRDVVARYVRAKSTSGDVTYDGSIDPTGRYELASHSGSVELTIPDGVSATFSIATYNGAIDSDFPITLRPGEHGLGSTKRFTFEIGRGEARITAESFSGDITIRSKTSSAPHR
jgi:hypothetical protein